jgi:hypothetical protein
MNGRLFTLASYLEITEVVKIFGYFFHGKSYTLLRQKKMGGATFWATFLQTNLVTPIASRLAEVALDLFPRRKRNQDQRKEKNEELR